MMATAAAFTPAAQALRRWTQLRHGGHPCTEQQQQRLAAAGAYDRSSSSSSSSSRDCSQRSHCSCLLVDQ
jgi:hypothetical protein